MFLDVSFSSGDREQRARRWSRSRLGRAGDGARELLPWTAGPGAQKNFDPEHPLAGDSKGRSLALVLYSIQFVSCPSSLALCISHPPPIPRVPPCLRARVNVCECRGGKRSKVSPRGALNLPAARFLQTKRFDPLPSPPNGVTLRTQKVIHRRSILIRLKQKNSLTYGSL